MSNLQSGIFTIAYGTGMFVWAQVDFAGLVRLTGIWSKWAFVMPSTRIGLSAISIALVLFGTLMLIDQDTGTTFQNVASVVMGLIVFGAFIHDLVCAASEREA